MARRAARGLRCQRVAGVQADEIELGASQRCLIFVAAMLTLRAAAVVGRYARSSHLVGGGILLVLGAVMILRPEWLG